MAITTAKAFGNQSPTQPLENLSIERRALTDHDVEIDIMYCGVCHSDIHTARDEWGGTKYPCVPGHEIVGKIISIGNKVDKYKVGDLVGVGCLVDSCGECENCEKDLEQFCENGSTQTYNGYDKHFNAHTFGGYSESIVVDENFVLRIPENLELSAVAPLLCAGITTYSPLRHWGVSKGKKVGVVGIGGLGHMAIKLASAMGAHVTVFTTSESKKQDAIRLGADEVVLSTNDAEMKKSRKLDFIIDAVSAQHDINAYLNHLTLDGTLTLVGAPENPLPIAPFSLIMGRKSFAGSLIGGILETQEMLDFCGKHNIVSDIELIDIQNINEAYERMIKGDVKYRFVIDMQSLKGKN